MNVQRESGMRVRVGWAFSGEMLVFLLGVVTVVPALLLMLHSWPPKLEDYLFGGILLLMGLPFVLWGFKSVLRWVFPCSLHIDNEFVARTIKLLWLFELPEWRVRRDELDYAFIRLSFEGRNRSTEIYTLYLRDKKGRELPVARTVDRIDVVRALAEFLAPLFNVEVYIREERASGSGGYNSKLLVDPKKVEPPFMVKLQMLPEAPKIGEVLRMLETSWKDKLRYKVSAPNIELEFDVFKKALSDTVLSFILIMFVANIFIVSILFTNLFHNKVLAFLVAEGSAALVFLSFLLARTLTKYKLLLTPNELVVECYMLGFPRCVRRMRWEDVVRFFGGDPETRIVYWSESGVLEVFTLKYLDKSQMVSLFKSYVYHQVLGST